MSEVWKEMVGHPKFLVSSEGRVSDRNGKIYAQWVNHEGYAQICVSEKNHKFVVKVHREVAKAFIPKPEGRMIVNHKDGNKLNNNVGNLEWCTYSYNAKHAIKLGLAKKPEPIRRPVVCVETGQWYESTVAAERAVGVHGSHITKCCKTKIGTVGGFHWVYAEDYKEDEMPKTATQTENERKDKFIREQICGKMKANGISSERMADELGVSLKTFYRLRKEPERMTIKDVRIIQEVLPGFKVE